jgi:hypothetical protein
METIVRQNALFQRTIKPDNFRTWHGEPRDVKPFTQAEAPCMRWTPQNGPENFRTPEMMTGPLLIRVEMLTRGSCCDDMTNLWWMLERCFYPGSSNFGVNPIIATLQGAGALSGLVFFDQPAFDPDPDGVFFAGQGQMRIEVRLDMNS